MDATYPLFWFDTTSGELEELEKTHRKTDDTGKGRKLRCHICEHVITFENLRISIAGNYEHIRTNPHGYEFQFECFQRAPGCSAFGNTTNEHSWFAGYQWQIAVCGDCGEHLGWLFKGEDSFFGLISVRLIRED